MLLAHSAQPATEFDASPTQIITINQRMVNMLVQFFFCMRMHFTAFVLLTAFLSVRMTNSFAI